MIVRDDCSGCSAISRLQISHAGVAKLRSGHDCAAGAIEMHFPIFSTVAHLHFYRAGVAQLEPELFFKAGGPQNG